MFKRLCLVVLSFVFMACSVNTSTTKLPSIEGKEWKLVSFGYTKIAVPEGAYLGLKDGRYFGNSGCNGMGGEYILKGEQIQFKPGMSTMMACPDMSLETKFRIALHSVNSFEIKDDTLILMQDKHPVLNFMEK